MLDLSRRLILPLVSVSNTVCICVSIFSPQRVYDPVSRSVVHLMRLPAEHGLGEDLSFLGPPVPDAQAVAIAQGLMDPVTRTMFPEVSLRDPQRYHVRRIDPRCMAAGERWCSACLHGRSV